MPGRFIYMVLFFGCLVKSAAGQHPWLIKDINSNVHTNQLGDGTYIGIGGSQLGVSYPGTGNQLFQTNNDNFPAQIYNYNGFALFFANDGLGNRGLYRTDGTAAGTSLVSTLGLASTDSNIYIPATCISSGNLFYFQMGKAGTDTWINYSLWRSDGTPAGTFPVFSGPTEAFDPYYFADQPVGAFIGNELYFQAVVENAAQDSIYTGIYKTDGTVAGTSLYIPLQGTSGQLSAFSLLSLPDLHVISFNNKIYYTSFDGQIYYADGTNPPNQLPNANGSPNAIANSWVNVNNQYLAMKVYGSWAAYNYVSPIGGDDSGQLEILYPAASVPVSLGYSPNLTFFPSPQTVPVIVGSKLYFFNSFDGGGFGTPSYVPGVTDGTAVGTFYVNLSQTALNKASFYNGSCSAGALFGRSVFGSGQYYVWDGVSPSSYKVLSNLSDSINAQQSFVTNFASFGDTLLAFSEYSIVYQADAKDSYCYRVSNLYTNGVVPQGTNLSNGYITFADDETSALGSFSGGFPAGLEPSILRPYQEIWRGGNSADWNNNANWLSGRIPGPADDVVIPPVTNYPVINAAAECRNLIMHGSTLTINNPANLTVAGWVANYNTFALNTGNELLGNITGSGTLTRTGAYSNKTYGSGRYNVDSININGADLDLTSVFAAQPNVDTINSVINFKSPNKLIMNYTNLVMTKKPYFTGFSPSSFVLYNRKAAIYFGGLDYITNYLPIWLTAMKFDSTLAFVTIPMGSSPSSYTPLVLTSRDGPNSSTSTTLQLVDTVSYHGNPSVFAGVVNKTWLSSVSQWAGDSLSLGWTAADEGPGFNRNACFIAYYDGGSWVQGKIQSAVLNNGVYSVSKDHIYDNQTHGWNFNYSLIVASNPCITSAVELQPLNDTVCAGGQALFTISGTNTPGYQWQVDNGLGSGWLNLADTGVYSGSSSDSLMINNVSEAMNNYRYQCLLINVCNGLTSSSASLLVHPKLSSALTIQSTTQSICRGATVSFMATPANGGNAPSYQWLVNGNAMGTNSAEFKDSTLQNGDVVSCTLTTGGACTAVVSSNSLKISVNIPIVPTLTISSPASTVCRGSQVTFTAIPTNGGTSPNYQWQVNGIGAGSDEATFTTSGLNNGDLISCILNSSDPCTAPAVSNSIAMTVSASIAPSVSITASADSICSGSLVSFTATAANAGDAPGYLWQVNGNSTGSNSPSFSSSSLNNGDSVKCELTSNSTCAAGSATSNSIQIAVTAKVSPSLDITTPINNICQGASVTFTADQTNGGGAPDYQWLLNGDKVGTDSATFTSTSLNNADVVSCQLTSDAACASGVTSSNRITMAVSAPVAPALSILSDSANHICAGGVVTFEADPTNGGSTPSYQWLVNGANAGVNAAIFSTNALNNGDQVTCVMTSTAACAIPAIAWSNTIAVAVAPQMSSSVTISASANNICAGTPVTFIANPVDGGNTAAYQWLVDGNLVGSNGTFFTFGDLHDGDSVYCIMTSSLPCTVPASSPAVYMVIYPLPTIAFEPDTLYAASGSGVLLNPIITGLISQYQWSPPDGLSSTGIAAPTASPATTTTYELLVTADSGCKAMAKVTVIADRSLEMPGAFTPNGDGHNDVFRIPPGTALNLSEFAIFNRWGAKVFSTRDVSQGWNGIAQGGPSPAGTYIYFISGSTLTGKQIAVKGTVILIR